MSSAMATQQFAANVLRTGARKAVRSAPVRANRMTVRAAASNGGLPIDLRGAFPTDSFASSAPHATSPAHHLGGDPSQKRPFRVIPFDPSRVVGQRACSAPSPARARAEKSSIPRHPSRDRIEKRRFFSGTKGETSASVGFARAASRSPTDVFSPFTLRFSMP